MKKHSFPIWLKHFLILLRSILVLSFGGWLFHWPGMMFLFIITFLVHLSIISWGMFLPNSQLLGPVFSSGRSDQKVIALTFDDGPSQHVTSEVLDILKQFDVLATFFVVGIRAQKYPALIRRMKQDGHEIENHTWKHPYTQAVFPLHHTKKIIRELQQCNQLLLNLTQTEPRFVRFPAGVKSFPLMAAASRLNLVVTGFSVRAFDSCKKVQKNALLNRIKSSLYPGAVVVLHDGHNEELSANTSALVQALPELLSWLNNEGYQCVPLRTLYQNYVDQNN